MKKLKLRKKSAKSVSNKRTVLKTAKAKQPQSRKAGSPSKPRRLKLRRIPRTPPQYFAMSEAAQEKWNRVAHVVAKMRSERVSLTQAAKEFAVRPRTVVELGGSALRKRKNGKYVAKANDRLLRILVITSPEGLKEVAVRDSRTASEIAVYSDAVQKYLRTGDMSKLRKFRRLRLTDADGKRIKLLIDPAELSRLGSAGVLSFESLYARVA